MKMDMLDEDGWGNDGMDGDGEGQSSLGEIGQVQPRFVTMPGDIDRYLKEITAAKILVIDDDPDILHMVSGILRFDGFTHVRTTSNSQGALSLFLEFKPDLVLLDLMMPAPDGLQLLRLLAPHRNPLVETPVLVITAEQSSEAHRNALSYGAADYLTKPFAAEELCLHVRLQLRTHYRQRWLYQRNCQLEQEIIRRTTALEGYELELRETQAEVTVRLARAAEHHDTDTGQHTQRVALTCLFVAQEMGLDDEFTALLRRAAPLHDVGKIGVPDPILHKPGKLDVDEQRVMQSHSKIGADLLTGGRTPLIQMAEQIALNHHERWDGGGYPHGLKQDKIPLEGRIVAVADVFDALVHNRPYKRAWSIEDAVREIKAQRGRQFDPDIVDAFTTLPHDKLM